MTDQPALFDAEPVPRTRAGTHLERSGAELEGPLIEVCDGCRCAPEWNPGRCPTPEVHTWKDPGQEPEEGADDVDEKLKEEIANQVDTVLALQGEDIDGPAARAACLRLLGQGDFAEYPTKKGEQVEFVDKLAVAVLSEIGQAPPEQRTSAGVAKEGWDAETEGAQIIKTPIGF